MCKPWQISSNNCTFIGLWSVCIGLDFVLKLLAGICPGIVSAVNVSFLAVIFYKGSELVHTYRIHIALCKRMVNSTLRSTYTRHSKVPVWQKWQISLLDRTLSIVSW